MRVVIDNASGPTGVFGIILAKLDDPDVLFSLVPKTPSEVLIFFSTLLVICQLVHWGWRAKNFIQKKRNKKNG